MTSNLNSKLAYFIVLVFYFVLLLYLEHKNTSWLLRGESAFSKERERDSKGYTQQ